MRSTAGSKRNDVIGLLGRALEKFLDRSGRLADAMLVLDKGQTHEIVTVLAKADAGRNSDIRMFDQQLGELQRTEMLELFEIGAQANIEAAGAGMFQPARPKTRPSRRGACDRPRVPRRYPSHLRSARLSPQPGSA
jgi:hypothetical protein